MARALRRAVPLKAMCSRKCDRPCSASISSRAPAATHTPSETVSSCGMVCETTRRPLASLVTSGVMARPRQARACGLRRSRQRRPRRWAAPRTVPDRHQGGKPWRQRRPGSRPLHGIGEFRGMGRRQHDFRVRRAPAETGFGCDDAAGRVRVGEIAGLRLQPANAGGDFVLARRCGGKFGCKGSVRRPDLKSAGLREGAHLSAHAPASRPEASNR